jgi:hypothetical protein
MSQKINCGLAQRYEKTRYHQEAFDRVGGAGTEAAVCDLKVVQTHIVERRDEQLDRRVANLREMEERQREIFIWGD